MLGVSDVYMLKSVGGSTPSCEACCDGVVYVV